MKRICIVIVCSFLILTACGTEDKENNKNEHGVQVEHSECEAEDDNQVVISMENLMEADETPINEFDYTITEDGVCINRYTGNSELVVIPQKIENVEVVKISNQAFANIEKVQAVRVADTVKDMSGYGIFINCSNLKYLVFGENVEEIGEYCISGCFNLEKIKLRDNLKKIGTLGLYTASDKLKEIHVPQSVIEMGEGALNDLSVIYVKSGSYAEEYMKSYTSAIHDYVVE